MNEYISIGIHWVALYVNAENVIYFDRFGFDHIPKGIRKFFGNKNIELENSLEIKILKQTFIEYKYMIQ